MAFVTPRISLKVWNSASDPYNSQQLADNWIKVDLHDHSSGKGTQIPTAGLADSAVTSPKVADGTLTGAKLAPNTVANSNLAPDAKVDPLFNAKRILFERALVIDSTQGAGTFVMTMAGALVAAGGGTSWADSFWLDPTDYPTGTRSAKVRILGGIASSSVAPASDFTLKLVTATSSTGSPPKALWNTTITSSGTVVGLGAGAGANFTPSSWIDYPTAGYYALAVTSTSAFPTGSAIAVRAQIQVQII